MILSESFKSKVRKTGSIPDTGNTKDVEIVVPLKYLNSFWRTFERPLVNCKISLILTWSEDWMTSATTAPTKFAVTDTKPFVPVLTLSMQDNTKLFITRNEIRFWKIN